MKRKYFSFDRLHQIAAQNKWFLPVLVYTSVALVMTLTGYLYYQETLRIALDKTGSQLETLNNLKQEEVIQWIHERDNDLTFYQTNKAFVEEVYECHTNPQNETSGLKAWLKQTQKAHNYDIFVIMVDSSVIYLGGSDSLISDNFMDAAMKTIHTGIRSYYDIYRKTGTDKLYYSGLAPLMHNNHAFAALIFRSNAHDYFVNELISDKTHILNLQYNLVKNDGDSLYYIDTEMYVSIQDVSKRKLPENSPLIKALDEQQGVFIGSGIDNKEIIASVKKIAGSDWFLVVHTLVSEVEEPLTPRKWIIASYILLIMFLFILWYYNFVQRASNKNLRDQLRLNEELLHNRAILQTVTQSSPLPLIVITLEGKILIWNNAASQVFGWNFIEILKVENPIFNQEQWIEFQEIKGNVLNSGNTIIHEMQRVTRDGKNIDLRCWITELIDPITKEVNLLFIFDDITERKQISRELKSLNESLEQRVKDRTIEVAELNKSLTERANQLEIVNSELESFTYSVSHDLKAPLRSIQGFTDIILQEHSQTLNEEVLRLMNIVCKNARRMDQLIKDLLDLSRVTRSTIKTKVLDIEALIKEIINNDFHQITENTKITIHPLPEVEGDAVLLQQALINLISNAVKYTRKVQYPQIEIGSFKKYGMHAFFIKDNGAGFNQDYAGKLFNTFQRLHTNDQFEGTGVGLAIVKRIISKHGGEVWAEGKENEGATFYFSIPTK